MSNESPLAIAFDNTKRWANRYAQTSLRPDLVAGLTVTMIAVPQSMAYAQLAGLPPLFGLYTVIIPTIVGALAGSSPFLITGASNATSLATAGILAAFVGLAGYPEYAFMMAILSGLIRLGMGLLKLGGIMRYVSNSVLTGLLAAVGALIIINQLPTLLGIPRPDSSNTLVVLEGLFKGLGQTNPFVLATGLFAIAVMLFFRRLSQRTRQILPGPLLAIVLAALLVQAAGWREQGVQIVSDLSALESAGLRFHAPQVPLSEIPSLLPGALALAFFSLMEAINVAKAISVHGGRIDPSREFIGQGLASLIGGFFQCFPTSGSPARTTLNWASGARTQLAAAYSGVFAWVSLLVFANWIGLIPNAGLAGVLIISATGVFNWQHIRLTWESRGVSGAVMVVTFISALLLPLHLAIYAGVGLSILIYLYETGRLRMSYLTVDEQGRFIEHGVNTIPQVFPKVVIINIEGPLYFGATEDLERQFIRIFHSGAKVVILRMRRVHLLASTGVTVLENILRQANVLGILVLFSGVTSEIEPVLKNSGLANLLGPEKTFPASQTLFSATREALQAAWEYINRHEAD